MHIEPDSLSTGHDGIVPRLQKGPTIHSSAWVVPGATVLGDVILEEESSVWYGAVLSRLARKGLEPPARSRKVRNGVPLLARRPASAPRPTMTLVNGLRDPL